MNCLSLRAGTCRAAGTKFFPSSRSAFSSAESLVPPENQLVCCGLPEFLQEDSSDQPPKAGHLRQNTRLLQKGSPQILVWASADLMRSDGILKAASVPGGALKDRRNDALRLCIQVLDLRVFGSRHTWPAIPEPFVAARRQYAARTSL